MNNGGLKYMMSKLVLYKYLYDIKGEHTEIIVKKSGPNNDVGWLVEIRGPIPVEPKIEDVLSWSTVRQDSHIARPNNTGHLITVDRYATAKVIAALFDKLAEETDDSERWKDVE